MLFAAHSEIPGWLVGGALALLIAGVLFYLNRQSKKAELSPEEQRRRAHLKELEAAEWQDGRAAYVDSVFGVNPWAVPMMNTGPAEPPSPPDYSELETLDES